MIDEISALYPFTRLHVGTLVLFVSGARLISADYCQLELRLLTHYSEDQTLTSMLTSGQDPFTSIAAHWSGIPVEQVSF